MHAHVTKSEFLHQHFGEDLLWSHAGTSAQRPMFAMRWLKNGKPIWSPYIERTFFSAARIVFCADMQAAADAAQEALPAPARPARKSPPNNPDKAPTGTDPSASRIQELEKEVADLKEGGDRLCYKCGKVGHLKRELGQR